MAGWIADSRKKMEQKGTTGSFTKAAKRRGMDPKEMADKVTSNPDQYSEKLRKKAQWLENVQGG